VGARLDVGGTDSILEGAEDFGLHVAHLLGELIAHLVDARVQASNVFFCGRLVVVGHSVVIVALR
jgi:hypothetical protein